MSLRSCPLCHLIFGSTNELVWHIHSEHHYLTEEEGLKVEVSQAASAQLDEATLGELVLAVDEGSMSLLLSTTPGPQMTSIDLAWVGGLPSNTRHTPIKASTRLITLTTLSLSLRKKWAPIATTKGAR